MPVPADDGLFERNGASLDDQRLIDHTVKRNICQISGAPTVMTRVLFIHPQHKTEHGQIDRKSKPIR